MPLAVGVSACPSLSPPPPPARPPPPTPGPPPPPPAAVAPADGGTGGRDDGGKDEEEDGMAGPRTVQGAVARLPDSASAVEVGCVRWASVAV